MSREEPETIYEAQQWIAMLEYTRELLRDELTDATAENAKLLAEVTRLRQFERIALRQDVIDARSSRAVERRTTP
jgi:hypothetical protein